MKGEEIIFWQKKNLYFIYIKQKKKGASCQQCVVLSLLHNYHSLKADFIFLRRFKYFSWCRSNRSQILFKTGALNHFPTYTGRTLCWSLFLIRLQAWRPATLLKKTSTQVLSCEYCEILKSSFLYRTPTVSASRGVSEVCDDKNLWQWYHL